MGLIDQLFVGFGFAIGRLSGREVEGDGKSWQLLFEVS
jgi:hypothetical protein